eukprot:g10242.t1
MFDSRGAGAVYSSCRCLAAPQPVYIVIGNPSPPLLFWSMMTTQVRSSATTCRRPSSVNDNRVIELASDVECSRATPPISTSNYIDTSILICYCILYTGNAQILDDILT